MMTLPDLFVPGWTAALTNHLWQSTAVAIIAWLLTIALRANAARVRYAIWMVASMKFLVPFSVLTRLGGCWAKPGFGRQVAPAVYSVIEDLSVPLRQTGASTQVAGRSFGSNSLSTACAFVASVWVVGFVFAMVQWIFAWRRVSGMAKSAERVVDGREFDALRRAEHKAMIRRPISLLISDQEIEPGVFGVIHPVLLWPSGLSNRLDGAQIGAIMAHEVEHARRHDNLTAVLHGIVEALFWFHPLVRWMTARLDEERERACDERVIEQNAKPEAYADSILKVCAFCLEPAVPCVSGVSGADLKDRVQRIITGRSGIGLNIGRKAVLSAAAVLLVIAPLGFGLLHGQEARGSTAAGGQGFVFTQNLPKYEVATVKPTTENEGMRRIMMTPDGVSLRGVPLDIVIRQAFGVEDDRIIGAPGWTHSSRWDIEAKVSPEDAPKLQNLKGEQRRQMLLPLLAERFNLKYHVEQRELPTYALVIAKGGPRLSESKPDNAGPREFPDPKAGPGAPAGSGEGPRAPGKDPLGNRGMVTIGPGRIDAHGGGMGFLTHALSPMVGRTILDKTGLTGQYDFTLQWTPDPGMMPSRPPGGGVGPVQGDSAPDQSGPSLFTALEEQLGLKLESQKSRVDVIVIDHIDLPSEN